MKEKEIFKQLPLNGNENDYINSVEKTNGYSDLVKALNKFYKYNRDYNPRQLHYIIEGESLNIQFVELIGKRIEENKK